MKPLRTGASVAVVAAAGLVLPACGSGGGSGTSGTVNAGRESAGSFVTRILRDEVSGRWAAQWEELHPGQQKLITQDQYVLCSERIGTNVGTKKDRFRVHQVRNAPIHERGVPERSSKLVTISVAGPGITATFHVHAVLHQGQWRWVLGPGLLQAVAHGECLDGSQLSGST